jgi:hypothetical protein
VHTIHKLNHYTGIGMNRRNTTKWYSFPHVKENSLHWDLVITGYSIIKYFSSTHKTVAPYVAGSFQSSLLSSRFFGLVRREIRSADCVYRWIRHVRTGTGRLPSDLNFLCSLDDGGCLIIHNCESLLLKPREQQVVNPQEAYAIDQ